MKQEYKIVLIGCLTIGLFDTLDSIASREFNFNYSLLASFSLIIYCAFSFWGAKQRTLRTGVLIAAAIGLFDSTIGWEISMLLKANTGNFRNNPTIGIWIVTIIFVTSIAALCGLIGGGLANLLKRKNKP